MLGTQVADGQIKAFYCLQGRTFKLKFTNDDATAEIKYRLKADVKWKGIWTVNTMSITTITVKKGEEKFDNWPLATESTEVRNVEIEIIDWNYK